MTMRWYELGFPKDLQPDAVVGFVRTLAIRPRHGAFRTSDPVVLRLVAINTGISWQVGVSERQDRWLNAQLRGTLPHLALQPIDPPDLTTSGAALGVELRVRNPGRPLRSDLTAQTAQTVLSGLAGLTKGESVVVTWIVGPWLPRHVPKPTSPASKRSGVVLDPLELLVEQTLDHRDVRALELKQKEAVYGTVGRVVVSAGTPARRTQLAQHVVGSFQLLREPGTGLHRRLLPSWWVRMQARHLAVPVIGWPCPLNATELASVLAWPVEGVNAPGVEQLRQRLLEADARSVIPEVQAAVMVGGGRGSQLRIVGRATHPARPGLLTLGPRAATQHLHVVAPTGTGKSTLLANLAAQDIAAGRTVVVIEPKGDLIAQLCDRIPAHRIDDVVLLDPTDTSHPVGVNVLSGPDSELTVDQLVHVLHSLHAAHWGPRTQDIFHAGLLTLTRAGGYTLIDLPALLTDAGFRRQVLSQAKPSGALGSFWAWFEALSEGERFTAIGPVMNKLRRFTLRESGRNLLGQTNPPLRFDQILQERKIVLVNLAKGRLGPETAQLLGAVIVAQLWNAILSRSAVPAERRAPAMVYVDEFQDYTRLATDLGDALAQARGLGVGFTLAHQHLGQLGADLRSAVLANARSRVVFQAGDDAAVLAKTLGRGLTAEDLRDLDAYHCYLNLVTGGAVAPTASGVTLPLSPALGSMRRVVERSRAQWSRPAEQVAAEIEERQHPKASSDAPVGGRRRQP